MKVLATPMDIPWMHKLWHYLKYLNVGITKDFNEADLIFNYNYSLDAVFYIPKNLENKEAVNKHLSNIRKDVIEKHFFNVFGYTSFIDPLTYKEKYVEKSVRNAVHDGKVYNIPLKERKKNKIYQKLIDNSINDKFRDIRVVIMKDEIPVIFVKEFNNKERFTHGQNNTSAIITDPKKFLSKEEIENIIKFTTSLKLDFGELDVLRDNIDERIYIVDVNSTPGLDLLQMVKGSTEILAEHFKRIFL